MLCAYPNGQAAKIRKFVVVDGFSEQHDLGVYNNNLATTERAFIERYFLCDYGGGNFSPAVQPKPNVYYQDRLKDFRLRVTEAVGYLPRFTYSQVVESYTGSKRRLYSDAHLSLLKDPVCERDAVLHSFVKFEKQNVGKAPRCINPRSPRFNLELARFLKHAEKRVYKAINKVWGGRTKATVIKGVNADESAEILRQKWDRFADPVAIGLDATKFDMHVSEDALRYEHSFYTRLYPGCKRLEWLLSQQLLNRGVAYLPDGKLKFRMKGTRSSGDINTSLGNCIIMCALIWSFVSSLGIDAELANNGDDCVVIMESSQMTRFIAGVEKFFRRHGFVVAVEAPVYEFEQIEFCQTRPVQLSTGWRMVRNLDAVLQKDPMCLVPVENDRVFRKWLGAVGVCGTILNCGVPVHEAFYQVFDRSGDTPTEAFTNYVYRGTSMMTQLAGVAEACVDARARVSYYYAFGVTPDQQRLVEQRFSSMRIGELVQGEMERDDLRLMPGIRLNSPSVHA